MKLVKEATNSQITNITSLIINSLKKAESMISPFFTSFLCEIQVITINTIFENTILPQFEGAVHKPNRLDLGL